MYHRHSWWTPCGGQAVPSATNFVTVDCGEDGAFAARLVAELARRDVFVRMPGVAPQNRCVRIGVGRPEELGHLECVLPAALDAVRHEMDH